MNVKDCGGIHSPRMGNGEIMGEYDDSGDKMFYTTLLVFERRITGTISTSKNVQSREGNEDAPFAGYETFDEIESDEIKIGSWSSMHKSKNITYDGKETYCINRYTWLKEEDEAMFVRNILNEGGLRSMFVGKAADEVDDDYDTHTFRRAAIVICPVKNIIKMNDAGPGHWMYVTYWVLRDGCRIAPPDKE